MTDDDLIQAAERLSRYDWQDWTAQDIEDAEGIVRAFRRIAAQAAQVEAERDAQRRDLEKVIRNQRAELRRLQSVERVHWASLERWKGTREGLEGKLRAAELRAAGAEATVATLTAQVEAVRGALQGMVNNACAAARIKGDMLMIVCTNEEWDAHVAATARANAVLEAYNSAALTTERDDAVIKRAAWEFAARQMEAERDALTAQVEAMRGLLKEARDDIAEYVNADYPEAYRAQYPDMDRRYRRDMELCWRIDTALAALTTENPNG